MPKQSDDLELGQVHQHKLAPGQLHNFPSKSRDLCLQALTLLSCEVVDSLFLLVQDLHFPLPVEFLLFLPTKLIIDITFFLL
jgi:hypothetical protein